VCGDYEYERGHLDVIIRMNLALEAGRNCPHSNVISTGFVFMASSKLRLGWNFMDVVLTITF
jgi:hypothetical protein